MNYLIGMLKYIFKVFGAGIPAIVNATPHFYRYY